MEFLGKDMCPYCRNKPSELNSKEIGWPLIETPDANYPVAYIVCDTLFVNQYGSLLGCPIQYCPMCGRKLTDD